MRKLDLQSEQPTYKNFAGLKRFKDKLRVAQFGPMAYPEWIESKESHSQKYRLFMYVHQTYYTKGYSAALNPDEKTVLYECLWEALDTGDSTTFRLLADVVENFVKGLKQPFYPDIYQVLKATQPPEEWQKDPELRGLWAPDLYPTNAEVLKRMGKDPSSPEARRSLSRTKKGLGIHFPASPSGRPKKKR
jgi:hypothetical protein